MHICVQLWLKAHFHPKKLYWTVWKCIINVLLQNNAASLSAWRTIICKLYQVLMHKRVRPNMLNWCIKWYWLNINDIILHAFCFFVFLMNWISHTISTVQCTSAGSLIWKSVVSYHWNVSGTIPSRWHRCWGILVLGFRFVGMCLSSGSLTSLLPWSCRAAVHSVSCLLCSCCGLFSRR